MSDKEEEDNVGGTAKNLMKACFGDSDSEEEEDLVDDVVNLSESEDEKEEEEPEPVTSSDDESEVEEVVRTPKPKKRRGGRKIGDSEGKKERKTPEKKKKKASAPDGEKKKRAPKFDDMERIRASGFLPEKRKRKKVSEEESRDINQRMAKGLLDMMEDVAAADEEALSEGRIAVKKLEARDQVVQGLRKIVLWDDLLNMNLLEVMLRWLKPSRDGELPDIGIRSDFLQLLYDLPVSNEQLKQSKIGVVVKMMYQSPHETHNNRLLSSNIISKWTSQALQIKTTHKMGSSFAHDEDDEYPVRKKSRVTIDEDKDPEKAWLRRQQKGDKAIFVRVRAQVSDLDFKKRPPGTKDLPETTSRPSEQKIRTMILKNQKRQQYKH